MVDMDKLADALNKIAVENADKLKIETNIETLQQELQQEKQTQPGHTDQPEIKLEAGA